MGGFRGLLEFLFGWLAGGVEPPVACVTLAHAPVTVITLSHAPVTVIGLTHECED